MKCNFYRSLFMVSFIGSFHFATLALGEDTSLQRVLQRKVLRVAAEHAMPYYGVNAKTGEREGYEYEMAQFIAQKLAPDMKLEVVAGAWEKLPEDVRKGKADLLFHATFRPDADKVEATDLWSDCYYDGGLSIIYPAARAQPPTASDLKSGKVVIFPDDHAVETVKKLGVKKPVLSNKDPLYPSLIKEKKADFVVYDLPAARYLANKHKGIIRATETVLPGSEGCYAAMAPKESKALMDAVNKAIGELKGSKKQILEKYGI